MKYINIARKYLNENYNFEDREITKYDYIFIGLALGAAVAAIKSVFLFIGLILILAHFSFKK